MKQNVSPAVIGVAVVVLIAFCIFMYSRATSGLSPRQLPPPSTPFKSGYSSPNVDTRHPNGMPGAPNGNGGGQ